MGSVNVNVICGDGQTVSNLAFDSKRSLLRLRVPVIRLAGEQHGSRRKRTSIADRNKWCQIRLRDTGIRSRSRLAAQYLPLCKHSSEDLCGIRRRGAQDRHQGVGNLPDAVDIAKRFYHSRNLEIDG